MICEILKDLHKVSSVHGEGNKRIFERNAVVLAFSRLDFLNKSHADTFVTHLIRVGVLTREAVRKPNKSNLLCDRRQNKTGCVYEKIQNDFLECVGFDASIFSTSNKFPKLEFTIKRQIL